MNLFLTCKPFNGTLGCSTSLQFSLLSSRTFCSLYVSPGSTEFVKLLFKSKNPLMITRCLLCVCRERFISCPFPRQKCYEYNNKKPFSIDR